jgi:hypothetical protein
MLWLGSILKNCRFIEIQLTPVIFKIWSKFAPNLTDPLQTISCPDLKFSQVYVNFAYRRDDVDVNMKMQHTCHPIQ